MCRLFALRASQPTQVRESLLWSPYSLRRQSCCDGRGLRHDNGWGIGYYSGGQPYLTRSACSAQNDGRYQALAESITPPTVLAHVRQASVGAVVEQNSHPFLHRSWMFAHNGTLRPFAENPERLRRLIPDHLRPCILGDTDSEHLFYFLLGRLEQAEGYIEGSADAAFISEILKHSLRLLADLFPGEGVEQSEMNFVLTDSRVLVASRWGHSLYWLKRRGCPIALGDKPAQESPDYQAIALASEPTTTESAWAELPDRTVLYIQPDLTCAVTPVLE